MFTRSLRFFRPTLFAGIISLGFIAVACYGAASDKPLRIDAPRIPERDYLSSDLGLKPDARTAVTDRFQSAVDHVIRSGGGRLVIEPGEYLLGPVTLGSGIDIHLSRDAVIKLLPRENDYPVVDGRHPSLFTARDASDIRISGQGRIDGQGESWWRAYRAKAFTARRPQLVALERCDRVELLDFTTINPPNTHFALRLCREVTIRGLVLDAPDDSPNTDGLNISGKNYLIERCRISTGDDNIVVLTHSAKDWTSPVCENFVIRDCALGFGHGLSIGSYTGGGIRGILAERITFDGTTSGIRMKAARDRGGLVEDLTYRDITMRGVKNPVFISSYYPKEPKQPGMDEIKPITASTPRWNNILIENLHVTDAENSLTLWGVPELPLGKITLRDVTFAAKRGAKLYYAPGTLLERVSINASSGSAYDYWPASPAKADATR